jgi:predicted RNA-binding Zn-ribbon protein involved in translation (DUF1610 family)
MSTIEYNLMGMDAFGIQRTAVFALLTGLVCVGAFILDKNTAVEPAEMIFNYLFAAIAGVVCFVLNMIIFPREKKEKEPEEVRDWKEVKEEEKPQVEEKKQQQPVGQLTGLPTSIDLNLVIPKNRCPDDCKVANIGVAATKYEVDCPTCGKKLSVKQASYHRCPSCGKVFQLNIGKIGKLRPEGMEEEVQKGKKNKKVKKTKKTAPEKPVLMEELSFDA